MFEDQLELLVGWVWGKATRTFIRKKPTRIFFSPLCIVDGDRPFRDPRKDFDDVLINRFRRSSCDVLHTT